MGLGENVAESAKIVEVRLGEYCHVSCYLRDSLFQEFDLKKRYADNFLTVWDNVKGSLLELEDAFAATVYLDKHIEDNWLYASPLLPEINPVSLIFNYIETGDSLGYEVEDNLKESFRGKSVLSDPEILSVVSGNISLRNRKDKIALLKINTTNYVAAKEEYVSLCKLVRRKYNIIKANPMALDDFVYESSLAFFRKFVPNKILRGVRVDEIAYTSESDWQFMKSMTMILGELKRPPLKKQILYKKDGYVATLNGSLENPHIIISTLSFNMVLHGHPSSSLATLNLFELQGEEFWSEARHEYARKHEEKLLFNKRLVRETPKELKISSKCSERYHMTLGEIQAVLKQEYGIEVTESAIGLTVKKALKKIEKKFETIGINKEDHQMLASL